MTAQTLIAYSSIFGNESEDKKEEKVKSIHVALEILKAIEYKNFKNDVYYGWRANGNKLLKNYQEAVLFYSKAIQLSPDNAAYYRKRAECKMNIKNYYGAISDITKVLTFTPNDDVIYGKRAICYLLTDQWDKSCWIQIKPYH